LRFRYESFAGDEWGAAAEADHDYLWSRVLPYAEVRRGGFRARGHLVAAFESGDEAGRSAVDENRGDLLELFAEVPVPVGNDGAAASLHAGRRILVFGSERLISARYGPNVPRSFDTAGAVLAAGPWRVDLLWGRPVENEEGTFDDEADRTRSLWAAYGTRTIGGSSGIDLYAIGFEDEEALFEQGAGREVRTTFGSRLFGERDGWDWNGEVFAQTGRFEGDEIRAGSITADAGHTFAHARFLPRLGLRASFIDGDDDPADGELNTFNPLFPKGKYFGEAGLLGPSNLLHLHPSLALELAARWDLDLGAAFYWRESTDDGIYDLAGNILRPAGGSDERFIGTQLDLAVEFAATRAMAISAACSLFLPGEFIEETGPGDAVRFLGGEVELRF